MKEAQLNKNQPVRERFVTCAWHEGGRSLVDRKTGAKVQEPLLSTLKEKMLIESDGICDPCRTEKIMPQIIRRMTEKKPIAEARM
jgi:hypothetical protein